MSYLLFYISVTRVRAQPEQTTIACTRVALFLVSLQLHADTHSITGGLLSWIPVIVSWPMEVPRSLALVL